MKVKLIICDRGPQTTTPARAATARQAPAIRAGTRSRAMRRQMNQKPAQVTAV